MTEVQMHGSREKRTLEQFYWRIAVGVGLAAAALFWLCYKPLFATNDDTSMAAIAYGYNGQYESNLVFSNILLGKLLMLLLHLWPTVPWYTVLQCVVVLSGFVVLVYLFLQHGGIRGAIIPITILVEFFGYDYFSRIQFSQTAGITTIAGFLLLFFAIKEGRSAGMMVAAIALITIGSMYRFSVFLMCLVPLFGVGVNLLIPHMKNRDWGKCAEYVLPVLVVFLLCVGIHGVHIEAQKSTPEWREYTEYNELRAQLLDYGFPSYEKNERLYAKLNISEDDLQMFRCWNFADPEIFNAESMRALIDAKEKHSFRISDFAARLTTGWLAYTFTPALFLSLLLAFCTGNVRSRKTLLLLYEVIAFLGVLVYLYIEGRYLIKRVDISLMLAVCVILLLYCQDVREIIKGNSATIIMAGLLLFANMVGIQNRWQENLQEYADDIEGKHSSETVWAILNGDKQHIYLCETFGIRSTQNLWQIGTVGCESNLYYLGGWGTDAPFTNSKLKHYGVTNPYRDAVDNADVLLIAKNGTDISQTVNYIKRHYAADAYAIPTRIVNEEYTIYRILSTGSQIEIDVSNAIKLEEGFQAEIFMRRTDNTLDVEGTIEILEEKLQVTNIFLRVPAEDSDRIIFATQKESRPRLDNAENQQLNVTFTCNATLEAPAGELYVYIEMGDGSIYEITPESAFAELREKGKKLQITYQQKATYEKMALAVWSLENGQDDLAWYEGGRTADGAWRWEIDLRKHSITDPVVIHAYGYPSSEKEPVFVGDWSELLTESREYGYLS